MATTNGDSLTELERQAEANRAELAQTVDELHNRVSPQTLKEDMRNYARDKGQHMLESIEARARDNPLQAVAIAAGLAYPIWRMIGRMPAPLLLIGAGLALSGRSGGFGQSHSSYAGNGYGYRSRSEFAGMNGEGMDGGSTGGDGMLATAKEKVSSMGHQISEKVSDTISSVREKASNASSTASDMLHSTYRSSGDAAASAMDRASETYERTRESMADMIERHPLLVGGVAFAVGSLVASSLPVTRQENRLMGETADEIKRRTQDMAHEGMDQARTAARQVYETASTGLKEEGLSPEVARETVRAAVDSVRGSGAQGQAGDPRPQPSDRSGRSS